MKKYLNAIAAALMALAVSLSPACSGDDGKGSNVTVSLNKTSLALFVGDAETLVATVGPDDTADKTVSWTSSAPGVATVTADGGLVRAVSVGSATITAAARDGGRTATCNVTVSARPATVYVAGTDTVDGASRATLWKNGAAQPIGNIIPSRASSVFVSSDDVYVAGGLGSILYPEPTLWKNGVAQRLSDSTARANSVFVSGDDVYVAGTSGNYGMLWKNGNAQELGTLNSYAYSVFVSGEDAYVAGLTASPWSSTDSPMLWKNGVGQILPGIDNRQGGTSANSVFVSGDDVYVAGRESYYATLWKNGVRQRFGNYLSDASSVFVSGDDVYVAGSEREGGTADIRRAVLWKNGVAQRLSETQSNGATSVFVLGGDVYVTWSALSSDYKSQAMLWKNGVSQQLGNWGSGAASVFVVGPASGGSTD